MQRTVITINGDVFHLPERNSVEELAVAILQAARNESEFVDMSDTADGTKRVLITPSSAVTIELIEVPDDDEEPPPRTDTFLGHTDFD